MPSYDLIQSKISRYFEEELALWRHFCLYRDQLSREALIKIHLPFARMMAAKIFAKRMDEDIAFDDYHQFARVGLLESIEQFDPDFGVKFESFAEHRIRGAILSALEYQTEKQQQISLSKRVRLKQEDKSTRELSQFAASFKDERAAIFETLTQESLGHAIAWILENTGCVVHHEQEQHDFPYYRNVELKQLRSRMQTCIEQLTANEQKVIRYYFFQEVPLAEIAELSSLSKGRISQIKCNALNKLRRILKSTSLEDFIC